MTDEKRAARFWAKTRLMVDGCWLWEGATTKCGYGTTTVDYRTVYAHRWAYEALVGPIPEGMQLDHLCRVRNCVRPDHLEPVTLAENVRRGRKARGAAPADRRFADRACINGHAMTDENTYVDPLGRRNCRECIRIRGRRYYYSRKAAA